MDYVFKNGEFAERSHLSSLLVLLDLNLPGVDGYQILEQMKQDKRTRHIPVVVLTTTDDDREVAKCYDLGCNMYITKPVDYAQFSQAIFKIGQLLSIMTVPRGE
jgi:CheY-like chemotaxis protein